VLSYASTTNTRRNLDALRAYGWHLLVSASGALRPHGFPYAIDNGAWSAFLRGASFDVPAFERAVRLLGRDAEWIVAPDIVQGGMASHALSSAWIPRLLGETQRVLFAVQDGMENAHVSWLLGPRVGLFVGGSTPWKLATMGRWAKLARDHGAWCHVGRVNTARRIQLCASVGVDSFDGTSATKYAVTTPRLSHARDQLALLVGE
jgi:hypothetical protein